MGVTSRTHTRGFPGVNGKKPLVSIGIFRKILLHKLLEFELGNLELIWLCADPFIERIHQG